MGKSAGPMVQPSGWACRGPRRSTRCVNWPLKHAVRTDRVLFSGRMMSWVNSFMPPGAVEAGNLSEIEGSNDKKRD